MRLATIASVLSLGFGASANAAPGVAPAPAASAAPVIAPGAPLAAPAGGVSWQEGTLPSVLGRAQRDASLVFINFFATWSGPCQEMDADVYSRDEVARVLSGGFIALRRDGEHGEGLELAQRYHVFGFPSMLVLDARGEELDRLTGSVSSTELVQQLERLRQGKGTLAELERMLVSTPTDTIRLEVATRHALRGDPRARAELEAVVAGDPDNRGHRAATALLTLGKYCYLRADKDYARAERTLAELERRFPTSEEAAQAPYQRAVARQLAGRPIEARAVLDAWIVRAPKDAERLAAYAWFCFKEGGDRVRGIEIARRGLALRPNDAGLWDTLGELYAANGDPAEARKAFLRAAELQPKNPYYRSQLAKLGGTP